MSNPNDDVIIIGAGVAGLSAALHLAERGLSPLVFEADPQYCGGRLAGGDVVELDGWRFRSEHGVHGIWASYRNLQAMLARHTIRPAFVPAREETWICKRGGKVKKAAIGSAIRHSWIPAPLHYLALLLRPRFINIMDPRDWLSLPMVWYTLILAVGIDPLREGQPMEGMWLSDLIKGWSPTLRSFFVGFTRNGLSAHPEEIPAAGFVAFLRFYTLLRRDTWNFSYLPADGGTSIIDPMVGKLRTLGGAVQMGTRVTHLKREADGWRVHWQRAGGEVGSTAARRVILATDAPNTAKILHSTDTTAAGLYWPRGLATVVVRFWFDRAPKPDAEAGIFSDDFILDNFFWLHRIQTTWTGRHQYAQWHKATGGSALEAHIYGPPELLEEPDAPLLARAAADVRAAFPELRGHRIHQTLQRNPPTQTLFGLEQPERHLSIETPWPSLYCCGDWVRHPAPALFLERACLTGIEAANAVLKACGLPVWPLLDYPPPEPFAGFLERLMQRGRARRRRHRR
ncbi:MAG: FAD-dependent oxidoreductase [Anaerolineales bacterium]